MKITYFVELAAEPLRQLFARPEVLGGLQRSGAAIALAMLDRSDERAAVVRALNASGIDVTAWLLLERAQGYWLNADNAALAVAAYREVRAWAVQQRLQFSCIGLDIEAPRRDAESLQREGQRAVWRLLRHRRSRTAICRAMEQYAALLGEIRGDGFTVESYQLPVMLDERRAGSMLLQRSLGLVDLVPDREVLMLYRSLLPGALGAGLVDAYGPEADAIAVGITGGGVDLGGLVRRRHLSLGQLLVELRRARRHTGQLYVFSLEGCVEAGYFQQLTEASVDEPRTAAPLAPLVPAARAVFRTLLRAEPLLDRMTNWRSD